MVAGSFGTFTTETATVKRPATGVNGKRSTLITDPTPIAMTRLYPVNPEMKQRLGLDTLHEVFQAFVFENYDINEGDIITYQGRDYPIRACEKWPTANVSVTCRMLVLEDLKP